MPSSPQINILYLAPGHKLITPDQASASNPKIIAGGSGILKAKVSPTMLAEYGGHASLIEAENMLYVAENTLIPVPKLFAAYAYGPIDRDIEYNVYIFEEFIEGEDAEKQIISADLNKLVTELRSLPAADYIGSVNEGLVTDVLLEYCTTYKFQL
jgi:hypothetical protein